MRLLCWSAIALALGVGDAAAQALSYSRVRDPAEGAFSIEVPAGPSWKVEGGTTRRSAIDVRHSVRVISADNAVLAFRGDKDLGMFMLPSQYTAIAGLHEGSVYPGSAASMTIRRYLPGVEFVRTYIGGQQPRCPGLRIVNQENFAAQSQQLMGALNQYYAGFVQFRIDAGAVDFVCDGNSSVGSVTATTLMAQVPGGTPPIWVVLDLSGFIAQSPRLQEAVAIVDRLQSSFQYDPAWARRQEQTTSQTSGILQSTQDSISRTILQAGQQRSRTLDRVFARGAEARRGQITVEDPVLGRRTITNSHRFYWTSPQGQIEGTDTSTPPGPGYRILKVVPP
jgi:hypothetical protein